MFRKYVYQISQIGKIGLDHLESFFQMNLQPMINPYFFSLKIYLKYTKYTFINLCSLCVYCYSISGFRKTKFIILLLIIKTFKVCQKYLLSLPHQFPMQLKDLLNKVKITLFLQLVFQNNLKYFFLNYTNISCLYAVTSPFYRIMLIIGVNIVFANKSIGLWDKKSNHPKQAEIQPLKTFDYIVVVKNQMYYK